MGAVATAWLATEHQQLMYLLSPEGKTVFYIPGVEVVHKVSTPINLPDEASKIKMEPGKMQPPPGGSRKRAAGLSLDLNSASAKRNKQVQSLLTSPDVQMLKLTSPELEKFLIQNPTLATPTPSGYIFPKSVTEEQAMYAKPSKPTTTLFLEPVWTRVLLFLIQRTLCLFCFSPNCNRNHELKTCERIETAVEYIL